MQRGGAGPGLPATSQIPLAFQVMLERREGLGGQRGALHQSRAQAPAASSQQVRRQAIDQLKELRGVAFGEGAGEGAVRGVGLTVEVRLNPQPSPDRVHAAEHV
jgi:hypothetical protein